MERVDVLLVCEVDDAVVSVVLDELERGIHLVRAVVNGGRRRIVELVAAPDVAVDDGGAAQGGGRLRRGLACLDNDPEQRWLDEAQRLAHPGEVEGMRVGVTTMSSLFGSGERWTVGLAVEGREGGDVPCPYQCLKI
jgi:hypothetical protein